MDELYQTRQYGVFFIANGDIATVLESFAERCRKYSGMGKPVREVAIREWSEESWHISFAFGTEWSNKRPTRYVSVEALAEITAAAEQKRQQQLEQFAQSFDRGQAPVGGN